MTLTRERLSSMVLAALVVLSVFAGGFAGSAAATHGDDSDATLEDSNRYWVGQTIVHEGTADTTYEVAGDDESNSGYFQQIESDSDGHVLIDTSDMESGNYVIEPAGGDGTNAVSFTVSEQSFSVSTADDNPSDATHSFEVDSNRVGFGVVVEADGLTASEVDDIFTVGSVETDSEGNDYYLLSDVSNGDSFEASFGEEYAGEYDFTFTVNDTGNSDAVDNFSASAPDAAEASFSANTFEEEEGDVGTFNISLANADSANVVFGSDEMQYQFEFEVTDGNDDGVVTVEFDTAGAGDGTNNEVSAADSEDSVSYVTDDPNIEAADHIITGNYPLSVAVDGEEQDVAAFYINERSTDSIQSYVIPDGETTNTVEQIENASTSGDTVALDDKLVFEVQATGLYSAMDDEYSSADLADATDGIVLTAGQEGTYSDVELDVSEGALRTDAENDRFFVVFDTADLSVEAGEEYDVEFNLTQDHQYIGEDEDAQNLTTSFNVVERELTLDSYDKSEDVLAVNNGNFSLTGTSTLAPGTEITVIARSPSEPPYLEDEQFVVQEDGTVSAAFDFSAFEAGDEFDVTVRDFDTFTAQVDDGSQAPEAYNLTLNAESAEGESLDADYTVDGDAVDVFPVELENGTYTVEANADGYEAASQEVTIDGEAREVTLTLEPTPNEYPLTVTAEDENGSAIDADVTVDGEAYSEGQTLENGTYTVEANADGYEATSQEVTIDGEGESVTLTLSEEAAESGAEDGSDEDDGSDDGGQPGFGLVVALFALIGAALLALRRQNN